jgi:hypothetical protein
MECPLIDLLRGPGAGLDPLESHRGVGWRRRVPGGEDDRRLHRSGAEGSGRRGGFLLADLDADATRAVRRGDRLGRRAQLRPPLLEQDRAIGPYVVDRDDDLTGSGKGHRRFGHQLGGEEERHDRHALQRRIERGDRSSERVVQQEPVLLDVEHRDGLERLPRTL